LEQRPEGLPPGAETIGPRRHIGNREPAPGGRSDTLHPRPILERLQRDEDAVMDEQGWPALPVEQENGRHRCERSADLQAQDGHGLPR
jgi:hypothetical protein